MVHNTDIILIFCVIYFLDSISIYLSKLKFSDKIVHHNVRWFFIHFFINLFVTLATINDLKYCVNNTDLCIYEDVNDSSMLAIKTAIVSHIYHCVFFFNNLNHHDWTHHILMVGVTGPLAIYFPTKQTACGLWFMSGFPGMLDYGLLWLVKMQIMDKKIEKIAYKHINTWIRSPGCLLTLFLGLPKLLSPQNNTEFLVAGINSLLAFWNGQYYMMLTCEAYGKNSVLLR